MVRDRARVSGLFAIIRRIPANDAYYILLHLSAGSCRETIDRVLPA